MIALIELHIKSRFKNLEDLHIDFAKNDGVTVFIGNNGSGKSNIIEALSSIFAGLYNHDMNPVFSYELKYKKDNNDILISYNHTSTHNKYTFNNIPEGNYLPNQVIGLYSGEELRLWERYYFKFYDNYNKNILSSKATVSEYMKMLFINKHHWDIALLTMLQSDLEIDDILGDKEISSITFHFDKSAIENVKNYNKNNSNEVTLFSLKILETDKVRKKSNNGLTSIEFPIELFKKEFIPTHTEFFKLLSVALLPKESSWKLITSIELWFRNGFSSKELSEGEKKLLLIKFITRILSDENSIFLLDEPDSHIHINNKERIKQQLYDFEQKAYVQSIITTHSPTLTMCFKDENLFMLDNGKLVEKQKYNIIQSLTGEFWNSQQQNIFLTSKKPIILLVEGKHDREHIKNAFSVLKDEYPSLNFEIFKLNSETNILPFMRGLYESDFDSDKLYIGIYDNDGAGKNTLENRKNFETIEGVSFKKIIENQKQNNNYFVCALPKPDSINCDCTIETMFESVKFEEAYKTALNDALGHFSNKSIDSIADNIKEQAKNILCENSKNFIKEDFKYFRKLFDLIIEIKKMYDSKTLVCFSDNVKLNSDDKNNFKEINKENIIIETPPNITIPKSKAFASKEAVLLRKTNADLKKSYLSIQNALFNGKIKGLKYRVTNNYISILVNRPFAYFYFTKNKIKLVVMKDYSTVDELIKNHNVVALSKSVKAFYRGECAGVLIEENNNLEEIVNLLVQIQR
ncbi:MAG: AAA family ATPase [Bacteroidales bacterium]|nr:AAA family ATPase [Bacteroidales bacterium]